MGESVDDRRVEVHLRSLDETAHLAARLAALLRPGDIVLLIGDLGAGKTTFTQYLAASLGVTEVVTSPTFTLMRHLPTTAGFTLLHLDAYRLHGPADYAELGVDELVDDGGVAVIEWGDVVADAVGPEHLDLRFTWEGAAARSVTIAARGAEWQLRVGALAGTPPC